MLGEDAGDDPISLFFSGHVYPKGAQLAHQLAGYSATRCSGPGCSAFSRTTRTSRSRPRDYAIAMEKVVGPRPRLVLRPVGIRHRLSQGEGHAAWNDGAKTLTITVNQTQTIDSTHPFFRFPGDGAHHHPRLGGAPRDHGHEAGAAFELALPGAPITFRFDEGGWLLGTVTTDQTPDRAGASWRGTISISRRAWWALARSSTARATPRRGTRDASSRSTSAAAPARGGGGADGEATSHQQYGTNQ